MKEIDKIQKKKFWCLLSFMNTVVVTVHSTESIARPT